MRIMELQTQLSLGNTKSTKTVRTLGHAYLGRGAPRKIGWGSAPQPASQNPNPFKDVCTILIVFVHPYCACKFTPRHAQACALNIKMNNDRADGLISIALPGFNGLGRLVTLLFFAETDFICNRLHIVQK